MIEYNIKIIFVSATPDVNLSIMTRLENNHKLVQLKNGSGYKGFEFFYKKKKPIIICRFFKNLQRNKNMQTSKNCSADISIICKKIPPYHCKKTIISNYLQNEVS